MFDPKKWIESASKIEDAKVEIGGKKVLIRRLNGTQWEHYLKAAGTNESAAAVVLGYGLIDENTGGAFKPETILEFCNACPARADRIATHILDVTLKALGEENRVIGEAEKNSGAAGIRPPTGDGVETSVKTQGQRKSADAS